MEMHSAPIPAVEAAPSIWQTMVEVFTSPTKAFDGYKKNPTILILLIVTMVIAYLMSVPTAKYEAINQYEMMKSSEILPPTVIEKMRTDAENMSGWIGAVGKPIAIPIFGLISALLALFFGKVIFGGTAGFKEVWGVVLLAGLIGLLGEILRIPLVMAKETFLVSYGLAAFFPGKNFTSILYALFFFMDVFFVWTVFVAGVGYAKIFGISRGKGIFTAFISSFIVILLVMALILVSMSFAGVKISFF
jgi:hypothetical protein